jgi:hypothetical protein
MEKKLTTGIDCALCGRERSHPLLETGHPSVVLLAKCHGSFDLLRNIKDGFFPPLPENFVSTLTHADRQLKAAFTHLYEQVLDDI